MCKDPVVRGTECGALEGQKDGQCAPEREDLSGRECVKTVQ